MASKIENVYILWPRSFISMYHTQVDMYKEFTAALLVIAKTRNNLNVYKMSIG